MPRNPQGLYTLPAGNPVVPNTLIESAWANATMDDIATALTGSLPRDGSAPMTGPLTLQADAPTQPRHAVSKGYMEQFLAYATGMPIGAIIPLGGSTVPVGYLLCDGQAVSRTTYTDLFASIGTAYGSGDGATTFNVPDLRDWFIRGRADARAIGSQQSAAFAAHAHSLSDPGHTHTAFQTAHDHTITTGGHSHGVNDPGHFHQATLYAHNDNGPLLGNANGGASGTMTTDTRATGISIAAVGNLGGSADARQPAVTVNGSYTGVIIGATGGDETRPQNVAMNYVIKAVNDAAAISGMTSITSSDSNMIAINTTIPLAPELDIKSNIAFGIPKLDLNAKIPLAQLPAGVQTFLGTFDPSGGQNPSQAFPGNVYTDGMTYLLSDTGTILVRDPNTNVEAMTLVDLGWNLVWLQNASQPVGWYFIESATVTASMASSVAFVPSGTLAATNVQTALEELDNEKLSTLGGTITGNLILNTASLPAINMREGNAFCGGVFGGSFGIGFSDSVSGDIACYVPSGTKSFVVSGPITGANLLGSNTGDQTAATTPFTPSGSISATNVQAALQEVDTETQAGLATKVSKSGDTMTGELKSTLSNSPAFYVSTPGHTTGRKGGFIGSYNDQTGFLIGNLADNGSTARSTLSFEGDIISFNKPISDRATGVGQVPIIQVETKASFPVANHFINAKAQAFWSYLDPVGGSTAGSMGFATTLAGGGFSSWMLSLDRTSGNLTIPGQLIPGGSDARLKENKLRIQEPLEKLSRISGYEFDWVDDGPQNERGHDTGLIAQEVQEVFPQCVTLAGFDMDESSKSKSGENYLTIKTGNQITALLIEAVKELSAKLDSALAEIAELKAAK